MLVVDLVVGLPGVEGVEWVWAAWQKWQVKNARQVGGTRLASLTRSVSRFLAYVHRTSTITYNQVR